MSILSRAEAYWLARDYSGSGDWLDGSGNSHDAQFGDGSTASTFPTFYDLDNGRRYVRVPGSSGNYISTPDSVAVSITGDMELQCDVTPDDWTPSVSTALIAKYGSAGNRSFVWYINTDSRLGLVISDDGTATETLLNNAGIGVSDGTRLQLKCTWDASTSTATFYKRVPGVSTWTQVGAAGVGAKTAIFDSAQVVEMGAREGGTVWPFVGRMHSGAIYNGIAGTLVAEVDFNAGYWTEPYNTATSNTGEVWTINRSATGETARILHVPEMSFDGGDYFEVPDHADLDRTHEQDFSIAVLFRTSDKTPAADQAIVAKKTAIGSGGGYALYLDTANGPTLEITDTSGSPVTVSATGPALTDSTWQIITAVRDGAGDDDLTVYTGTTAGTPVDGSTLAATLANAGVVRFGRLSGAGTSYLDFGQIGAVAYFNEALTAADVAGLQTEFVPVTNMMMMGHG